MHSNTEEWPALSCLAAVTAAFPRSWGPVGWPPQETPGADASLLWSKQNLLPSPSPLALSPPRHSPYSGDVSVHVGVFCISGYRRRAWGSQGL